MLLAAERLRVVPAPVDRQRAYRGLASEPCHKWMRTGACAEYARGNCPRIHCAKSELPRVGSFLREPWSEREFPPGGRRVEERREERRDRDRRGRERGREREHGRDRRHTSRSRDASRSGASRSRSRSASRSQTGAEGDSNSESDEEKKEEKKARFAPRSSNKHRGKGRK